MANKILNPNEDTFKKFKEDTASPDKNYFKRMRMCERDIEEAAREYSDYLELKEGLAYLRKGIIELKPTFFDPLKDPNCKRSGWDLILFYVKEGLKYRNELAPLSFDFDDEKNNKNGEGEKTNENSKTIN